MHAGLCISLFRITLGFSFREKPHKQLEGPLKTPMITQNTYMIWEDNSLPIIALQSTRGNPEVTFTHVQTWMFAHIQYLEFFWWIVWAMMLGTMIWRIVVKKKF